MNSKEILFYKIKENIKSLVFDLKTKSVFLPVFSKLYDVSLIVGISYLLYLMVIISKSNNLNEFVYNLNKNFTLYSLYVGIEIVMLLLSIPILKVLEKSKFKSILLIWLSIWLTNYLGYCLMNERFTIAYKDYENFTFNIILSSFMLLFFVVFFDWKNRTSNQIDNLAKINLLQSKMDRKIKAIKIYSR